MMAMLRILSMERFFQIVGQPLRLPWDSTGDAPALQLRSAEYGREQRLRQTEDRRPVTFHRLQRGSFRKRFFKSLRYPAVKRLAALASRHLPAVRLQENDPAP